MTDRSAAPGFDGLVCPGVFYPVQSGDGVLSRIRTPGGLVTAEQCVLVARIADRFAGGTVTVTNRANFQLRALADRLPDDVLGDLQQAGLASAEPAVDHLRNVMASPTAGLDADAILDTRPLVRALDAYIVGHPYLAALPAKFSVGLDGGERASIGHLPNDVLFQAFRTDGGSARFRVLLRGGVDDVGWVDLGATLAPDAVVLAAAAIADAYLALLPSDGAKPRLRALVVERGIGVFQNGVAGDRPPGAGTEAVAPRWTKSPAPGAPIGVHAQGWSPDARRLPDDWLTYVGIAPPVAGRLTSEQLRALAHAAERFGSGGLRLSPWRNVLIPDVPRDAVESLQSALESAGLSCRAPSLASGIVACAGRAGCASGTVDTVRDALALSARLSGLAATGRSLEVHFSGCAKKCAQRRPTDLTLLGLPGTDERYAVYVGDRLLADALLPADALAVVERVALDGGEGPPARPGTGGYGPSSAG